VDTHRLLLSPDPRDGVAEDDLVALAMPAAQRLPLSALAVPQKGRRDEQCSRPDDSGAAHLRLGPAPQAGGVCHYSGLVVTRPVRTATDTAAVAQLTCSFR